jgi:WD40 repeat protein
MPRIEQWSPGDRLAACIRGQGLPFLDIYALDNSGIQKTSRVSTRSSRHPSFDSSVSSSSSSAQARISLEAFDTPQAEVSSCKWSPCGTYIAVGRNDDRVDLFDSRFIKYGPVSRMYHGEPIKRTPWKALWGITGLEWVEGAGYSQQALVSGGNDGKYLRLPENAYRLRLQVVYDYGIYAMLPLFATPSPKWRRMSEVSRWAISANEKPRWSCE